MAMQMKRTDMERKERELRRVEKRQARAEKRDSEQKEYTVGSCINELHELFIHDDNKIYNIHREEKILDLVMDIKENVPEKEWENIMRKAIRKTKITQKEDAFKELQELLTI